MLWLKLQHVWPMTFCKLSSFFPHFFFIYHISHSTILFIIMVQSISENYSRHKENIQTVWPNSQGKEQSSFTFYSLISCYSRFCLFWVFFILPPLLSFFILQQRGLFYYFAYGWISFLGSQKKNKKTRRIGSKKKSFCRKIFSKFKDSCRASNLALELFKSSFL